MPPHAFVKRHRSASVESAGSTASNKRTTSSPAAIGNLAGMDLNDSAGSSSSSTEPLISDDGSASGALAPRQAPPEGATQLELVLPLLQAQLKEGDTWFVVDRTWYRKWQAACGSGANSKEEDLQGITPADLGPVDNSGIANPRTGKLLKRIEENRDAIFLPGEAWHFLEAWYGTTGLPVKREVIATKEGPILDLYPPTIFVAKVVPPNSLNPLSEVQQIQTSSGWTMAHLKEIILEAMGLEKNTQSRLWHLTQDWNEGTIASDKLADASVETAGDEDIIRTSSITEDARMAIEQVNEDGSWLARDDKSVAAPTAPPPPFGGPSFLDKKEGLQNRRVPLTTQPIASSSGTSTALTTFGNSSAMRTTRSQTGATSTKRGLVGLTNLGNTCFMNSALQCLSNTPSLQNYFYTGFYKQELNPDNPLGMNGEVARAFGTLIERIWAGSASTVTPREFKQTLSKFAPAFSGWQQHDSQELIAFLLDGLHEDLNRIKKKPYDEIPDWEGGGDKEEMELANKSWELYKRRNDSVIVDLFQGQYRSRLICPECNKVAIKFDPFMYLSLAIPQNKKWYGDVYLVPYDPKVSQKKVSLELPANATMKQLKSTVGDLAGYDPKKLFLIEEFSHKFYKTWSDSNSVSELQSGDLLVLFELPYEIEQPRYRPSKQKTPQEEGKFFVSVNCSRGSANTTYSHKDKLFGEPFILALTEEEACDLEVVERKLCERLESWTGAGSQVWASGEGATDREPAEEATSDSKPASSASARAIIPDDEEEETLDTEMAESKPEAAPVNGSREPNKNLLSFWVNKKPFPSSSYNNSPFAVELEKERVKLEERAVQWQSEPVQSKASSSSNAAAFGEDEPVDLYGDAEQEVEPEAAEPTAADTSTSPAGSRIPILATGETILVEWDSRSVATLFGTDAERKRSDTTERFSTKERIIHPAIQERKRGGGGGRGEKKAVSVDDLLDEFVREEKLSEDNTWYCPACKKHQQAQKKFDLWKMPDVLVIHLKRFSNERAFRDKIDVLVDFPIEGLDLSERVEGRKAANRLEEAGAPLELTHELDGGDSLIYDLYAVDNHFGGLGGGHYTSFAKNNLDAKWYNFDDSRVSPVPEPADVKTPAAYLLFYCRRSDKPIGGKTHEILSSQAASPAGSDTEADSGPRHSFRSSPSHLGLNNGGSQHPHGPPVGSGLHQSSTVEDDVTLNLDNVDGEPNFSRPSTGSTPPSPNVSDDENERLGQSNSRVMSAYFGGQRSGPLGFGSSTDSSRPESVQSDRLGWQFGGGHSSAGIPYSSAYADEDSLMNSVASSPRLGGPPSSPPAVEIRISSAEVAKAASEVGMDAESTNMDNID